MFPVILKFDAALGNGTRHRGELLAELEGTPEKAAAAASEGELPKGKLAEGVTESELLCALCNQHLLTFTHEPPPDEKKQKSPARKKTAGK